MEDNESFGIMIPLVQTDKGDSDYEYNISQVKLQLLQMDFKDVLIDNLSLFFQIQSVEEALQLMSKEKGIWQHNFIEDKGDLCLICQEEADHLDYKILQKQNLNDRNSFGLLQNDLDNAKIFYESILAKIDKQSSKLNKEEEKEDNNILISRPSIGEHDCNVCFDEIPQEEAKNIFIECHHYFCHNCWVDYLTEKITSGQVKDIKCMEKSCGIVISSQFIKSQLKNNDQLMIKYDKFSRKKLVANNPNMKLCPEINCEGYAEKFNDKFVKCSEGHKFCFNCLKNWHGKKDCQELIDKDFEKYKKVARMKQCPKCFYWTEKNEGCNHMTCRNCGTDWCWLCCKICDPMTHYDDGSCGGLQMVQLNCLQNQTIFFFYKIGKFMLTWVFYLILFMPYFTYSYYIKVTDDINDYVSGFVSCLYCSIVCVIPLILYLVFFFIIHGILLVFVFIPSLFYWRWLDIFLNYISELLDVEKCF